MWINVDKVVHMKPLTIQAENVNYSQYLIVYG
jgi:hypothetical protein